MRHSQQGPGGSWAAKRPVVVWDEADSTRCSLRCPDGQSKAGPVFVAFRDEPAERPRLGRAVAARVESTVVAVISGTLHDVGARAAGSRQRFERRPGRTTSPAPFSGSSERPDQPSIRPCRSPGRCPP